MRAIDFDVQELIAEYEKCERCRIVAEKFGCSEETVRRALIKNGVPRTNRHPKPHKERGIGKEESKRIISEYYSSDISINALSQKYKWATTTITRLLKTKGNGLKKCERNALKITNEELNAEINQGKNCYQIARKYNITPENVYRRARKMGLAVSSIGGGGHWYARCRHYGRCDSFDESITLNAVITKYDGICQICGQKVDKSDIKDGHIRKRYPTVDHIIPLSKGGSHTWDNVQLAHMGCNAGKCNSTDYTVKAKGV